MRKYIKYLKFSWILSIAKTIYFNLKYLPFKTAIKLPILIDYSVRIQIKKGGKIKVAKDTTRFGVQIGGMEGYYIPHRKSSYLRIENKMEFKGNAKILRGCYVSSFGGEVIFGENFFANHDLHVISSDRIEFSKDVLIGYNCEFRDTGGHYINKKVSISPILIGKHVWIASDCKILQGVQLKDGCVVATESLVLSKINSLHQEKSLIGGSPAKVLKKNIVWNE